MATQVLNCDETFTTSWTSADFLHNVLNGFSFTTSITSADFSSSSLFPGVTLTFTTSYTSCGIFGTAGFIQQQKKTAWGRTSKIGALDFVKDNSGEVVDIVMSWEGTIYAIKKLGNSSIVFYGDNGVTLAYPKGVFWGTKDLLLVGIKGKGSVCSKSDDSEHFFIDKTGLFWILKEGALPKSIDFSNYFLSMSASLVMNYDNSNDIAYICDGTYGYTYSSFGLGQGPKNITGVGVRNGVLYCTGHGVVVTDPFSICTAITDLGTRFEKTTFQVDLGSYSNKDFWVAIDYRWHTNQAFFTTPFVKADKYGRAFLTASGVEFRVKVKLLEWDDIQLDYVNAHIKVDDLKTIGGAQ